MKGNKPKDTSTENTTDTTEEVDNEITE